MKNHIFFGLLHLGSHVFASPSTNQLGDIHILAADDLISMSPTMSILHHTDGCVKLQTTVPRVLRFS